MGSNWTQHPSVSGLNAYGGIAMHEHGIVDFTTLQPHGYTEGETTSWRIPVTNGTLVLRFACGLLVASEVV